MNKKRLRQIIMEEISGSDNKKTFTDYEIEQWFHLTERSEDELRLVYFDYNQCIGVCGFGNRLMSKKGEVANNKMNYINEASQQPLSFQEVVNNLYQKYIINDWQIKEIKNVKAANNLSVICIIADINQNEELVTSAMRQMGYFKGPRQPKVIVEYGMRFKVLQFEPIVQKCENDVIRSFGYVIHSTPKYNLENIEKNGLRPNSKNEIFDYPNRVYLFKGNTDLSKVIEYTQSLCYANRNPLNNGLYTVLLIDLKKVPSDIKFYLDPNMEEACFTEQTIPSSAIIAKTDLNLDVE